MPRRAARGAIACHLVGAAALAAGCSHSDPDSAFAVPLPGEVRGPFDLSTRPLPPLRRAETPPPPIGASTLAIRGDRAVVSDVDREQVLLVDLGAGRVERVWTLPGEQPGRIAIDDAGESAWVVLRGAGAVVRLDLADGAERARAEVCPSPRGVAIDRAGGVHVACLGGLLLTLDAEGRETARVRLDPDLRDVVVADDGAVWVSRLRSAELFRLTPDAAPQRVDLAAIDGARSVRRQLDGFTPTVAWRLRAVEGGVMVVHQGATASPVPTSAPSGYGGGSCAPGIVSGAVTVVGHDGVIRGAADFSGMVLPVDGVDVEGRITVAAPGNAGLRPTMFPVEQIDCFDVTGARVDGRQVVAVDADGAGGVWGFSRQPPLLVGPAGQTIELGGVSVFDTGHDLFHVDAGGGIACASCHPEGGEDGHVWTFEDTGARRTQPLAGGLRGSEPFHWAGDLADLSALSAEVFAHRMGGPIVDRRYLAAWLDWIDSIPMPPADLGADPAAAARGRALFDDPTVACATCHDGPRLADAGTYDVGTGERLQTPTLRGVALRGPFMHDGCAETLAERFESCGGGDAHGQISGLDAAAIGDLVEYLRTL